MKYGISIGASKEAVEAVADNIMRIINAPCGDGVKKAALAAFTKGVSIDNATISHCHIDGSVNKSRTYTTPPPDDFPDYDPSDESAED